MELIPVKHLKSILELGIGEGTQHLLASFDCVYSFEVAKNKDWFTRCQEKIESGEWKKIGSWEGFFSTLIEVGVDEMEQNILTSGGKLREHDSFGNYLQMIDDFAPLSEIEVAFVDQGLHSRAETVLHFMEKNIPYIFCHDWNDGKELYGWNMIEEKMDKTKYKYFDSRRSKQGTRIWVLQSSQA
ncbi:MAG: hypothetical protein O3A82_16340 [Verrucomicrobia bacterium]|nr:hypothetical protein [Verrucomicrobiota bacterium]